MNLETKLQGEVKWFKDEKGYGFIQGDDGKDVFVHFTSIITNADGFRTLSAGQRVEYAIETTDKGDKAINVVVL